LTIITPPPPAGSPLPDKFRNGEEVYKQCNTREYKHKKNTIRKTKQKHNSKSTYNRILLKELQALKIRLVWITTNK